MTCPETPRIPSQRRPAGSCAVPLELRAVVCPGITVSVAACLRYDPAEPYAVYLDNHTDLDEPITWMFARDLLAAGMDAWAGTGDVSVHPGTGATSQTLFIALGGENGTVVLRAEAAPVKAFLTATERIVPFGAEPRHLDLDGLLHRLLEERPPEPDR
ncbi:SsgA family sporulation/cell division regulator [Streptomyces sp. CB01881]|uniref:SsgA family sporulation/cell division regulator n=1 Tax=Streptomyces sp. CB01881 TaxID=2078691 RepID=UPI000CDBAD30|nr:SsgA family sporulation/cell division regulator [Streptomyces sp. CB01881]AUY49176.1 SsgA family sporulation/cell division regulator [Streptomyces sp. CB01881]TYC77666.1 SsgA family sporulation/cell division regulator [Streptomyces sp. CB01881]